MKKLTGIILDGVGYLRFDIQGGGVERRFIRDMPVEGVVALLRLMAFNLEEVADIKPVTLKPTMRGPDQYAAPAGRFGLSVEELAAGLKRGAEVGMTAADLAESLRAGSR